MPNARYMVYVHNVYQLFACLCRVGDYAGALKAYTCALDYLERQKGSTCDEAGRRQLSVIYTNRAATSFKLKQWGPAAKDCRTALQYNFNNCKAHLRTTAIGAVRMDSEVIAVHLPYACALLYSEGPSASADATIPLGHVPEIHKRVLQMVRDMLQDVAHSDVMSFWDEYMVMSAQEMFPHLAVAAMADMATAGAPPIPSPQPNAQPQSQRAPAAASASAAGSAAASAAGSSSRPPAAAAAATAAGRSSSASAAGGRAAPVPVGPSAARRGISAMQGAEAARAREVEATQARADAIHCAAAQTEGMIQ